MSNLLFVYGTLLQSGNEFARYLNEHCTFISNGTVKGILYDIGEYPGFINDDGDGYVYGSIYQVNDDAVWKQIDAYEGYGADEEQPNLYIRKKHVAQTNYGLKDVWIYTYNLPVHGLTQITSGDYLKYLGQKKSSGS